tara:strand:+ start:2699 stop:3400 length:702 start_codon:yes stop_codon:yes gene_type:complete
MNQPKILVGCPTSNHKAYCLDAYLAAIKTLTYQNYDILLIDNSENEEYSKLIKQKGISVIKAPFLPTARERIISSRNLLREEVLKKDYDYFLSLEQDVIPPKDVLEQLLQHGKEVVTGVYYMEYNVKKEGTIVGKKILPLLYKKKDEEHLQQLSVQEIEKEELKQITASGLGCILISKEVLEQIKFRYEEDKVVFDDIWFCQDLEKEGIQLYVDTAIKCKHLMREMDWHSIEK